MSSLQSYLEAKKKRLALIYLLSAAFLICAFFIGITIGSTKLGFSEIVRILTSRSSDTVSSRIFWYVRFPRTLSCIVCGAALAVSGAVIQGVLSNGLASPSIIGVNSGAGLAVTVCTAFGLYSGWQLSLFSFFGAFAAIAIITVVSVKLSASKGTVILLGIALNSLFGAISDAVVTLNPDIGVMSSDFKIGDFSAVTYGRLLPSAAMILIVLTVLFALSGRLEILTLDDDSAIGLGMNIKAARALFLVLAALLAGCAVSIAGLLSFVGLLVPHTVRKISGNSYRHLLPLSAICGAAFVTVCDTVARSLFAPFEIPAGIIMAFLGAPFFVFLLIKRKGIRSIT